MLSSSSLSHRFLKANLCFGGVNKFILKSFLKFQKLFLKLFDCCLSVQIYSKYFVYFPKMLMACFRFDLSLSTEELDLAHLYSYITRRSLEKKSLKLMFSWLYFSNKKYIIYWRKKYSGFWRQNFPDVIPVWKLFLVVWNMKKVIGIIRIMG